MPKDRLSFAIVLFCLAMYLGLTLMLVVAIQVR